jgi:hypothetical protein
VANLTLAIATINAWNRFGVGFAMVPAWVAKPAAGLIIHRLPCARPTAPDSCPGSARSTS